MDWMAMWIAANAATRATAAAGGILALGAWLDNRLDGTRVSVAVVGTMSVPMMSRLLLAASPIEPAWHPTGSLRDVGILAKCVIVLGLLLDPVLHPAPRRWPDPPARSGLTGSGWARQMADRPESGFGIWPGAFARLRRSRRR